MTRSQALHRLATALALATCLPYAWYWPDADSWKNLWLVANVSPTQFYFDPLAAGFVFHFYFEPLWPLLYYVDSLLAPFLGLFGYHVVNLVAAAAIAGTLARLAVLAGAAPSVATAAAVLFLASPAMWLCIGLATARNYLLGTLFALLAVLPFWRAWLQQQPLTWCGIMASALAYGLAVGSKEAMAGVPLLLFVLALANGRHLGRALVAMLPHTLLLALLLGWRLYLLGGLGGYWMESVTRWSNLAVVPLALGEFLWASPWPAVLFVAALARRRDLLRMTAIGYVACAAPLILAGDITAAELYPYGAVRLIHFWALVLAASAASIGPLAPRSRRAIAVVGIVVGLLFLQGRQAELVQRGLQRFTPQDRLPDAAGLIATSDHSMALAFEHQLRPANRAPLASYQSPPTYQLDRALGFELTAAAERLRIRDDWAAPELPPLDLGSSRLWADDLGRMHLRLAPELLAQPGLTLTWFHQNGPTRWGVTLPVGRAQIDFPLSYSMRTLVLARIDPKTTRWPAYVWTSPFWRATYP